MDGLAEPYCHDEEQQMEPMNASGHEVCGFMFAKRFCGRSFIHLSNLVLHVLE